MATLYLHPSLVTTYRKASFWFYTNLVLGTANILAPAVLLFLFVRDGIDIATFFSNPAIRLFVFGWLFYLLHTCRMVMYYRRQIRQIEYGNALLESAQGEESLIQWHEGSLFTNSTFSIVSGNENVGGRRYKLTGHGRTMGMRNRTEDPIPVLLYRDSTGQPAILEHDRDIAFVEMA